VANRATLLAKQLTTTLPGAASMILRKPGISSDSDTECPATSALVESQTMAEGGSEARA